MADAEHVGLENLGSPDGATRSRRRVGRGPGSGSGKTAGRGHKGQKARSGGKIAPWFEGGQMPLYRRVPKRGFKNPNRREAQIVNLRDLALVDGTEIGPAELEARGLIDSASKPVKVLGEGDVSGAITVRAHAFSASARQKIEGAGGRVEVLD
jgi:large subunit ribosomal protein L15